ncbi:MAG: 1-acyl-sn-glycerol-3-phosphate acyltransferase [Gammaproteobacteria bacterium]|nr:1-acyl-sn-glycerol-3-phosphate acyltransferase [Gammaproteobacteria bacterium]
MTGTIALPVWIAILAGGLALWAVLYLLLIPGGRWFVRRRVNRLIDELNTRLQLQIPAFQQTKRQVLVDRLVYDREVMEAVETEAQESGLPREVLIRRVERHAHEIVPSFNAWAYFRIGYAVARRTVQLLYRVRLGYSDDDALSRIEPDASVVFVMNHRSNMDYVLVAYLAASRSALSYAVGEWARIWPLQTLFRSLGAYFVRRNSGDPLYRQVLARYVQAATAGGVVQAIYPEGNLSRDGRLRQPRLGLISYMLSAFDPNGERDLVFIPVGINYDRVLEDRLLVHELAPESDPYPRTHVVATLLRFVAHQAVLMLRRRWYRFGYACVNFGSPVSMRAYARRHGIDFQGMGPTARFEAVERLGGELLEAVASAIPVVPVPLVATVFARRPEHAMSELEIKAEIQSLIEELQRRGAYVHIPRGDRDYEVTVGLRMLTLRHFVEESSGLYRAAEDALEMLRYYANSIEHFLRDRR